MVINIGRYSVIHDWDYFPRDSASRKRRCWLWQATGHDKTLLESLKRNSPTLHGIARDFEATYNNADIVCYYENNDTSYGPLRTQVLKTLKSCT